MAHTDRRFDSDDETRRYLLSLKIILGADGLHPRESHALSRGMQLMGVSDAIAAEVERFEIRSARLEDYLPRAASKARARLLIYDAIRLACADQDYSDGEREAVARAARALGLDTFTVGTLEGLVQMERTLERMKRTLLQGE
jgi:hypothetical protein